MEAVRVGRGNDIEVNFVRDIRILHDAGYNVLTYDFRNHGHSGAANAGIPTAGIYEHRDVLGSLDYARRRADLRHMAVGLFSRGFGCNATFAAMARAPEEFADVRCLVGCQPLSPRLFLRRTTELMGLPPGTAEEIERRAKLATSFGLDRFSPHDWAPSVTIPTLLYQVRDDAMTEASDVQAIYDAVGAQQKELLWIDGSTRRWDGYNFFSLDPSKILSWFERHM